MKSEEIIVSVVMLAYNHEKYIAQAIESIVSQKTDFRFELLIGEDCSTDRTREIIRFYKKKYPAIIRMFLHKRNVGATKNVYSLNRRALGKYITLCEGDDYWCDDNRLQKDVDFLEANRQYVGICNRCRIVDEDGMPVQEEVEERVRFWGFDKRVFTLKDFERWRMPGHSSALTCRNIFLDKNMDYRIIYQASDRVADRTELLLKVLHGDIYCSDRIGSCYRFRITATGTNFMSQYKYNNLRDKDFRMIRRLENWTLEHKAVKLNLDEVKKDRLIGSVVVFMKQPTRHNFLVILRIIKDSGTMMKYSIYALKTCLLKLYAWKVKKKDQRIVL